MKFQGKTYLPNPAKKRRAGKRKAKKNPVPYIGIIANPKKKRRGKRRSAKRNPGLYVSRMPTRNPKKKTRSGKRRKNSGGLQVRHVILAQNPKKKTRRSGKRRASRSSNFSKNPPMKTRKRRRGARRSSSRRNRNPMPRRAGRRRGARRMGRRRNPGAIMGQVRDIFSPEIIAATGGVIAGSVGANTIVSKLVMANPATGQRSFDLPLVDYSMLASQDPAVRQTFWQKNYLALAGYKLLIAGIAGMMLRKYSPRLGTGVIVGGMVAAGTTILQAQNVVTPSGALATRGTGRNFPAARGTGIIPGTPALFTGPAMGVVMGRGNRGTGARVGTGTVRSLERSTEGAFTGAN